MHLGAGTIFFLVLAFGLFRCFPRLAAALVMLTFVGLVLGLVGYGAYYLWEREHPAPMLTPAALQATFPPLPDTASPGEAAAAVQRARDRVGP